MALYRDFAQCPRCGNNKQINNNKKKTPKRDLEWTKVVLAATVIRQPFS